jgi:hypothetical protein
MFPSTQAGAFFLPPGCRGETLVPVEQAEQLARVCNQVDTGGQEKSLIDSLGQVVDQRHGVRWEGRVEAQSLEDVEGAGVWTGNPLGGKILACHDTGGAAGTDARPAFVAAGARQRTPS